MGSGRQYEANEREKSCDWVDNKDRGEGVSCADRQREVAITFTSGSS